MKQLLYAGIFYLFVADVLAYNSAVISPPIISPPIIEKIKITLPLPTYKKASKNHYIEELLTAIFAKENFELELQYTKARMNQLRASKSLIDDEFINLSWLPYTAERAKSLLPIKIPLYKGLHGTRLLIINKNNLKKFEKINTLSQLRNLTGVQHLSWSDYDVLVNNKLDIKGDLHYLGMFKAVSSEIIDYFPRSALTIRGELKKNKDSQLTIEPTLVLKYPSYFNFFVNKKSHRLAKIIRTGMKKMLADGSFEIIFHKYYGHNIEMLSLGKRQVIVLKNDSVKLQKIR